MIRAKHLATGEAFDWNGQTAGVWVDAQGVTPPELALITVRPLANFRRRGRW